MKGLHMNLHLPSCLFQSLDFPGQAIVWDEKLAGPFSQVADYAFLRSHDVCKMYYINKSKLPTNNVAHIIFLSRAHTQLMDLINQQLRM